MPIPVDIYNQKIETYTRELKSVKQRSTLISFLRLTAFLFIAFLVHLMIKHFSIALLVAAILATIAFVVLIRAAATTNEKKRLIEELLFLNRNELNVINGLDNKFADGSNITVRNIHANDLDIFGYRSLYHLLNRTTTSHGRLRLAEVLNGPVTDIRNIQSRQKAVNALAPQMDIRQLITAHGLMVKEEGKIDEVGTWLDTDNRMTGKLWLNIVRFLFPVLAIVSLIYYLDSDNSGPVALMIILNWLVVSVFIKYTWKQHLLAGKKEQVLQQYASILKYFNRAGPNDAGLLQQYLAVSKEAHAEIFRLSKLTAILDQRMNLVINFIGNSFLQYDIHCMMALEKWKIKNRAHFGEWMRIVGEIEAINSLSTYAFNNPSYSYAIVGEGQPFIKARQLAHPLIKHEEQVANDITIGKSEKLLLVTGSNMSGKSTFLRTLGVNLLLAQCGAPVCAAYFEFSPMKILSSIRISDSLQENTSYFMAELKRLHEIIDELDTGKASLVLIDEVLRGTNSDDKTHGSEAFILKLLRYNCLSLFATHDLSLSSLEKKQPGRVANYCFESVVVDGELFFDYKLHKGVATNKNATFLMQKMGII